MPTCPTCGSQLHCMACFGKIGGSTSSPKKTRAVRKNARRPRPRTVSHEDLLRQFNKQRKPKEGQ